jgi:hypothetical protein
MTTEITFQDLTGESVSGRFEVSEGLITVTSPDGRKTTADIEESMLSPEILARVLLLQMHRTKQPDATKAEMKPRERPSASPPNDGRVKRPRASRSSAPWLGSPILRGVRPYVCGRYRKVDGCAARKWLQPKSASMRLHDRRT